MIKECLRLLFPIETRVDDEDIIKRLASYQIELLDHTFVKPTHRTPTCFCLEIRFNVSHALSKSTLSTLSSALSADILSPSLHQHQSPIKLAAFDMDSTLIQIEVIDELAKAHGVFDEVRRITECAMEGKINFDTSFKERIKLLKGLSTDCLSEIAKNIPFSSGVETLFQFLKYKNISTLLISGGFHYFAECIQRKLGIDSVQANTLDIKDNHLTGEVTTKIVGANQKALFLKQACHDQNIDILHALAVGDGANDIPMATTAGVSVGFRPKPTLKKIVDYSLDHVGLDGLIYLFD